MEIKEQCFAYVCDIKGNKTCHALEKLECKNCPFYQNRIYIKDNPFYAYSYVDIKKLAEDLKAKNISLNDVAW